MSEITAGRSYAHGTGDIPLLGCCLGEVLDTAARSYPQQDALVVRHQNLRYTYRQFLEECPPKNWDWRPRPRSKPREAM